MYTRQLSHAPVQSSTTYTVSYEYKVVISNLNAFQQHSHPMILYQYHTNILILKNSLSSYHWTINSEFKITLSYCPTLPGSS